MSQDIQSTESEKTLGGRYKIISQLGSGGFGRTFLAEDLHLPGCPQCVVKQLKPQTSASETMGMARRLFDTEAEVLYQLGNHDQIPRLLAHFEDNEEFYLAQEFIEGEPLTKELVKGQPWMQDRVIELLQDILQVLTFVHEQQVIHRDLKPPNLIRRRSDGKIVLIDFGAVKQVSSQVVHPETGETNITISIGTKGYMPNEQLAGTPRFSSDVYAVGMIGIQALVGIHPKRLGEDPQTGEIVWRDRAPHVSPELADIIDKMVSYDFRDRYPTASQALEALQSLPDSLASPVPLPQPLPEEESKEREAPPTPLQDEPDPPANAPELAESEVNEDATNLWVHTDSPVHSAVGSHETTASLSGSSSLPVSETEDPKSTTSPEGIQRRWAKYWPLLALLAAVGATFGVTKIVLNPQFATRILNQGDRPIDKPTATATPSATPKPPPPKPKPQPKVEDLLRDAEKLRKSGKYEQALELYDQVIKIKPKLAPAYWGRCESFNNLKKPDQAIVACNDALAINPDYAEALWSKGKAYEQQKLMLEALGLYKDARVLKPNFAEAWVSEGMALQSVGRSAEALWSLDRAIELNRNSAQAWVTKGEALWNLGDLDEAIVALDKALQLQPSNSRALKLRQEAKKELGR